MVRLMKIKMLIRVNNSSDLLIMMRNIFRKYFKDRYYSKIKENRENIETLGGLIFGVPNIWLGLVSVKQYDSNYFCIKFRDNDYSREFGIKRNEIMRELRAILELMEIKNYLEIVETYEE